MDSATLTPVSTDTTPAQGSPESTAEVKASVKPATLPEKAAEALRRLRAGVKQEAGKPVTKPEDAPAEQPVESTEEVQGQEGQEGTQEGETEGQEPILTDNLEEITYKGKKVPLIEALEDGKLQFEVYAQEKFHEVDGLPKLLDLASIGIAAAEKNRIAKEAVAKADQTIRDVEAGVERKIQEGVNQQLNQLLENAKRGINGNGQPFKDAKAQQGAVALLEKMQSGNGVTAPQTLSTEDIDKLVQKRLEEKLSDERKRSEDKSRENQVLQTAKSVLVDATKADAAYFTKTDGKLNIKLFDSYRKTLTAESDSAWVKAGKPTDPQSLKDIVAKVRTEILPDFQISNPKATATKKTNVPSIPQSTGAGVLPKTKEGENPLKGMTYAESIAYLKKVKGFGNKK